MKKARFPLVAIAAVLVVSAAVPFGLACVNMYNDCSHVSCLTHAVARYPSLDLSESVEPSSLGTPQDQTDNTTMVVTSGGAVRASFTVVSQPDGNQEATVAAQSQATPRGQAHTAASVHPEPGGLPLAWILLMAICPLWIVAACGLAFLHFRGRGRTG